MRKQLNNILIAAIFLALNPGRGLAGWATETADSFGNVGQYSSIDYYAPTETVYISYYDAGDNSLRCARKSKGQTSWSKKIVDTNGKVGKHSSIKVDDTGTPHICYFDEDLYDLKYAKLSDWTANLWDISTIETFGDVGRFCSLDLDAASKPHVTYYDSFAFLLKHARWDGASWIKSDVDSIGNVAGSNSDVKVDGSGRAHVTYFIDSSVYDLKYASWTGTCWSTHTVDSASMVGEYSSLALDTTGYAHISYYDLTNSALKYARWTGVDWDIQTPDNSADVGKHTSICVDGSGHIHISYYSAFPERDLKYAYFDGSWNIYTVDYQDNVGEYTSIVLENGSIPHISYYDSTNQNLKYTTMDNAAPSVITDLTASTGLMNGEIDLDWTAPGDDGTQKNNSGGAYYTLKYATYSVSADTDTWWNLPNTLTYVQLWTVGNSGAAEHYTLTLDSGTTYFFALKTTDAADNVSAIDQNALSGVTQASATAKVTIFPESSVLVPVEQGYYNSLPSISGTASDGDGSVTKVEISILNQSNSSYWNGSSWIAGGEIWLIASGTSSWSYSSPNWLSPVSYRVRCRATDNASNVQTPSAGVNFYFNSLPPVSSVDIPVNGIYYKSMPLIQGTAVDALGGLSDIDIKITRVSDGNCWSGSGWFPSQAWLAASSTDTWTFDSSGVTWTSGQQYIVFSSATDNIGNRQTAVSSSSFFYDTGYPVSSVTFPAENGVYDSAMLIYGTAADSDGSLQDVSLSIKNVTDNTYWNGGGWQGSQWWELVVSSDLQNWTYTSPAWTNGKRYLIQTRATDNANNIETPAAGNSFIFDTSPPVSAVTVPLHTGIYSDLDIISGTSNDPESDVIQVSVSIRNNATGKYWDGAQWAETEIWNTAVGTETWTYSASAIKLENGNTYTVRSRAVDRVPLTQIPGTGNTFTAVAPPFPPANLNASLLTGSKVRLTWEISTSDKALRYNIYYASSGFGIDFSSPSATVMHPAESWTSPALIPGLSYSFILRTQDIFGNEDPNISVVNATPVNDTAGLVKTVITVPQNGKKITGKRTTLIAEPELGTINDIASIRFEYRSDTSDWIVIESDEPQNPNPDISYPFFIRWNISGLSREKTYNVRAVATDRSGDPDPSPGFITVTVTDTDFDLKEDENSRGEYYKMVKIENTRDTTVKLGSTGNNITQVIIPSNSINSDTSYVTITLNPSSPPEAAWLMKPISEYREITVNSQDTLSNNKEATILIPYNDADHDGIVDNTNIPENNLILYYYNPTYQKWIPVSGYVLDKDGNTISCKTGHFSIFGIFQSLSENLDGARVFPNPFRGGVHSSITFDRLTKNSSIRIYTISGDIVWKAEQIDGQYNNWEVVNASGNRLASGIYICLISNEVGEKKIIKFAVIR